MMVAGIRRKQKIVRLHRRSNQVCLKFCMFMVGSNESREVGPKNMAAAEITEPGDEFKIRCRKLGHQIHFAYCRHENSGLPCFKILDCWYPFFPVEELLRGELTDEEWGDAFEKPLKPKILSLLELIEQAQEKTRK